MTLCKFMDQGDVVPAFTENTPFKLDVVPEDGILTFIQFRINGAHVGNISVAQDDGEVNVISDFRVLVKRKGMPDLEWNWLPRDLKWLTAMFEGNLPSFANPTSSTQVHHGDFRVYFKPPERLILEPEKWGIDTKDLAGPIKISGRWGVAADIGVSATVVTSTLSVVTCTERRKFRRPPEWALAAENNQLTVDSAAKFGPKQVPTASFDALWMTFMRQFDSSTTIDRVDGLIDNVQLKHTQEGELVNETFSGIKKRTFSQFGLANADVPTGIAMVNHNPGGDVGEMPVMSAGNELQVRVDARNAPPTEFTNVAPGTGDQVFFQALGVQFTSFGFAELQRKKRARAARAAQPAASA